MFLFAILAMLVVAAIAYSQNKLFYKDKNYIPQFVVTFVVTVVLMVTIKQPFGQKLLIFFAVIGAYGFTAWLIKAVGKSPMVDQTNSMRSFSSSGYVGDQDERRLHLLVRIVVALVAGLFIYFGYFNPTDCKVNEEWLYCQLHSGSAFPHIGAIMFLACCAFFFLIWQRSFTDKVFGKNKSFPTILLLGIGVLGVIIMFE